MPTKSQIRKASSADPLVAREERLLAEIERLRSEVGRLSKKLVEERADRAVQQQVHTVLSSLYCSPTVDPDQQPGRRLSDGRLVPAPVKVAGTVRDPESGAPWLDASPTVEHQRKAEFDPTFEFAPGDDSATAFDDFFNAPDPQLEKIRRFLLD